MAQNVAKVVSILLFVSFGLQLWYLISTGFPGPHSNRIWKGTECHWDICVSKKVEIGQDWRYVAPVWVGFMLEGVSLLMALHVIFCDETQIKTLCTEVLIALFSFVSASSFSIELIILYFWSEEPADGAMRSDESHVMFVVDFFLDFVSFLLMIYKVCTLCCCDDQDIPYKRLWQNV
ncbi:hypothetical protein EGW08_001787 [Elysia chlorotica]|uniref:Uncharacterized protein n=1 Tax=Elysia chlorotica TaxID=188477 RepID=A0A433U9K3_ELYCH|nr:hypothetical protein EGW08_001787 [Elysia chlorotica]